MSRFYLPPTPNCSCSALHTPYDCPTHGEHMRRQHERDGEWRDRGHEHPADTLLRYYREIASQKKPA